MCETKDRNSLENKRTIVTIITDISIKGKHECVQNRTRNYFDSIFLQFMSVTYHSTLTTAYIDNSRNLNGSSDKFHFQLHVRLLVGISSWNKLVTNLSPEPNII